MIINGDCLEEMKKIPDNHFTGIITDPPYGLKFMGKHWDHGIPGVDYWKEALRISKPGSHLLAFGGTRTYHRLASAIEDAGWEIRDCIMWIYGSGFPKSHNHFGFDGYGTALKPSYEPVLVAMKPCEGTFANNAEKWGVAGINIDDCRIESEEKLTRSCLGHASALNEGYKRPYHDKAEKKVYGSSNGRWPANVILDEEAGNVLDEQTGILKSGSGIKNPIGGATTGFHSSNWKDSGYKQEDSGGASRFFYCAKASPGERNAGLEGMPLKESGFKNSSGRSIGTNVDPYAKIIKANNHPTVKPLKLMEYLVTLIAPPKDGLILDPFCGSGTTLLACKNKGVECVGIEKEAEYCEIANARLSYCEQKIEKQTSQMELAL